MNELDILNAIILIAGCLIIAIIILFAPINNNDYQFNDTIINEMVDNRTYYTGRPPISDNACYSIESINNSCAALCYFNGLGYSGLDINYNCVCYKE